jgi:chemotaxis protein MotB
VLSKSTEMVADRPKHPGWITTFNDLITLLMVFFVLLFALSSIDMHRYKKFQGTLQSTMGVLHEGRDTSVNVVGGDQPIQLQTTAETAEMGRSFATLNQTEGLEAEFTPRGIQLTLSDELLFASGSAQLTDQGLKMLDRVGVAIKALERTVRVEGHTDDLPIATHRFPSNWELSTQRAVNVVKYFSDRAGIAPDLLSAAGYGASRPREVNDSPVARSRNRRVEIILGEGVH